MAGRAINSRGECHGIAEVGLSCMLGAAGELDYFSAHIRLREPGKSKDKAEQVHTPQYKWLRKELHRVN
ncbi:hypothetical protein B296_00021621 [Ensete ventricosum]|uniref:Uncharacterized protein n=1 Tax=Ensete ventricosum TaxID=4639 RepID=A0A426XRL5_ENSVE|nr:hypothetical protein B296_00021621 [Ensete ventricosum]